ncbi:hypothetical protein M5689_005475 [Euphorbia peplus]|nr:hypothetical protein M5689_005475 [Euphorbia peplus]
MSISNETGGAFGIVLLVCLSICVSCDADNVAEQIFLPHPFAKSDGPAVAPTPVDDYAGEREQFFDFGAPEPSSGAR